MQRTRFRVRVAQDCNRKLTSLFARGSNTVVCDGDDEARTLAFGEQQRHKVRRRRPLLTLTARLQPRELTASRHSCLAAACAGFVLAGRPFKARTRAKTETHTQHKHQVVSVDGTLFKPNGTFQGGRSGNLDARAGR